MRFCASARPVSTPMAYGLHYRLCAIDDSGEAIMERGTADLTALAAVIGTLILVAFAGLLITRSVVL
jgi:hypothetical protein